MAGFTLGLFAMIIVAIYFAIFGIAIAFYVL
jgi:hypothetical protein